MSICTALVANFESDLMGPNKQANKHQYTIRTVPGYRTDGAMLTPVVLSAHKMESTGVFPWCLRSLEVFLCGNMYTYVHTVRGNNLYLL